MSRPSVIVVGGGISGLTAAFRLQQGGFATTVLEADDDVGGKMSSVEVDGFTMNRAANILPFSYGVIRSLAGELGFEIDRIDGIVSTVRDGEIHRLRSDRLPFDALRTDLLSPRSKILARRILVDALRMRSSLSYENLGRSARFDVETAADYCRRRLNEELLEYLVDPVVRALFAANAADVSVVDFFFAAVNFVGSGFMGYPGGIGFLTQALAERLDVETGARVLEVAERGGSVEVRYESHGEERVANPDAAVLAVPASSVRQLFPGVDPAIGEILDGFHYGTTFNCHLGLSRRPSETSTIVQIPRSVDPDLAVVTFDHNSSPTVAPAGKGKMSSYWLHEWCEDRVEFDDAALAEQMVPRIDRVFPGTAGLVEVVRIDRWRPAVVRSYPGMYERVGRLVGRLDQPRRVQLAGDYLTASSTNGCAVSGEAAARRLVDRFFRPAVR